MRHYGLLGAQLPQAVVAQPPPSLTLQHLLGQVAHRRRAGLALQRPCRHTGVSAHRLWDLLGLQVMHPG